MDLFALVMALVALVGAGFTWVSLKAVSAAADEADKKLEEGLKDLEYVVNFNAAKLDSKVENDQKKEASANWAGA